MGRLKKHIASKVSGSKAGRKIIVSALGEEGAELIRVLKEVHTQFGGKERGKFVKENVFKFALKAKMMIDEKKLSEESFQTCEKLFSELVTLYQREVSEERTATQPNNEESKRMDEVMAKAAEVRTAISDVLNPHMTEKNQEQLTETLDKLSERELWIEVVFNPEYKEAKEEFQRAQHAVLMQLDATYCLKQNAAVSTEEFSRVYRAEIDEAQKFWKESVEPKKPFIAMGIFGRLVEKNSQYYNLLEKCIDGDDVEKQHARLMSSLAEAINSLDDWESLRSKLERVGKEHDSWAPGVEVEGYAHMLTAIHIGISAKIPDYAREGNETYRCCHVVLRLIFHVLEQAF